MTFTQEGSRTAAPALWAVRASAKLVNTKHKLLPSCPPQKKQPPLPCPYTPDALTHRHTHMHTQVAHAPVPELSLMFPYTMVCTLTAVPRRPVILLISLYLTARGMFQDLLRRQEQQQQQQRSTEQQSRQAG